MGVRRNTTKATRLGVYAAQNYLNSSTEKELGVQIPFDVTLLDPLAAKSNPEVAYDNDHVPWEPGISDGPTSARFAIVDYDGNLERLSPKAIWDEKNEVFLDTEGNEVNKDNHDNHQFRQVNVWAILQRALAFFEKGQGLGRRIPFGFEGNRLIVVPHAGYGENAFYDRDSKSLQFYYFDKDGERIYTCLSADIINHEFGHALLDGVRPHYMESILPETGAFHEFIGDLAAILITLRNNKFRGWLAAKTNGKLKRAKVLSSIAQQFGKAVTDNAYLRSAQNKYKMSDITDMDGPHKISQVLTATMFDILMGFGNDYIDSRGETAKNAFYHAIEKMQRIAIQPLDLLPPVDVTFKDYALAVLRMQTISNPLDPFQYFDLILNCFVKRKILTRKEANNLKKPGQLYERLSLNVFHDIGSIARSRATAYRFLDDNRKALFIPRNQDILISDLYDSNKYASQGKRLPRQIILEYIWHEELILEGVDFGKYEDQTTSITCGGTLVFDETGTVISWFRKSGVELGNIESDNKYEKKEYAKGLERKEQFLNVLKKKIDRNQIGSIIGGGKGLLGALVPAIIVKEQEQKLKFRLSPHLSLSEDENKHKKVKKWEISS
jgi:hypothetical protein